MADKRDNCIILLIEPPVPERIDQELVRVFGEERAVRIHSDLNAELLTGWPKNFDDAILILSFDKTAKHPDLNLAGRGRPGLPGSQRPQSQERLLDAFRLAFNTGAKKALTINHMSPGVKPEWFSQAFDSANDKTVSLGLNQTAPSASSA